MPKRRSVGGYQLADSPFFKLRTRKRLSKVLFASEKTISELSARDDLYVRCWKHKQLNRWLKHPPSPSDASDYRPIDIPDPRLKGLQARIADLLGRIAPPEFLFSPVKGRSYVDNAASHKGAQAVWLLDVADYFPSCTANNVARFFGRELGCSPDVVAILVRLTTHEGCLPQGSPCSPILAYYSNGPMWREVSGLTRSYGCTLSVYADDITVSGDIVPKRLIWKIKVCVHRHGLRLKAKKEVSLFRAPADITGVIVKGDQTRLPNRQLKKLATLREQRRTAANPRTKRKLDGQIAGRLAQRRQVESV